MVFRYLVLNCKSGIVSYHLNLPNNLHFLSKTSICLDFIEDLILNSYLLVLILQGTINARAKNSS